MSPARAVLTLALLGLTAGGPAPARSAPPASPAPRPATLFAEARREIVKLPPSAAADLMAFLANQELIARAPDADPDFKNAFARAVTLPPADLGQKISLELDCLEGLLALGDLDGAEQMPGMATAGRKRLCDRLMPEETERGRDAAASRLRNVCGAAAAEPTPTASSSWLAGMLAQPAQEGDIVDFFGLIIAGNATKADLHRELALYQAGRYGRNPLAALNLALAEIELGEPDKAPAMIRSGLAGIGRNLAAGRSLDGSTPLDMIRAAALAGELNFAVAGPWAMSLPAVWLKPVMLAQVASSAATAPDLRAGDVVTVLHGYWPPRPRSGGIAVKFGRLTLGQITRPERAGGQSRATQPIVDYAANRLIFQQSNVAVWVEVGASPHFSFLVDGLVNPTLEFVRGAHVSVMICNLGSGAPDFQILPHGPPFGAWPNSPIGAWGMVGRGGLDFRGGGVKLLPPPSGNTLYTVRLNFAMLRAGQGAYLTNARGFADAGAYGAVVVVP